MTMTRRDAKRIQALRAVPGGGNRTHPEKRRSMVRTEHRLEFYATLRRRVASAGSRR
jgi:hypothetical protein